MNKTVIGLALLAVAMGAGALYQSTRALSANHLTSENLLKDRDAAAKEMRTQRLMVLDPLNNPRVVIDGEGPELTFTMLDTEGTPRLQFVIEDDGGANYFVFDRNGNPRTGLFNTAEEQMLRFEKGVDPYELESQSTADSE